MKKKVYISGMITGIEEVAAILFQNAENFLLREGHDVVNPMKLNHDHEKTWQAYMKEDIRAMMDCDAVYMLANWKNSSGATIERQLALSIGMLVMYE